MNKDLFTKVNLINRKYEKFFIYGLLCFVFGIISTAILSSYSIPPLGLILLPLGIILIIVGGKGYSKIVVELKTTIINAILNQHVNNGIYRAKPGISSNLVYGSGVLRRASKFSSEDYIEGNINNVHFCFSDVHLEDEVSNEDSTHYVTVFRGQFFQFQFNKKFTGDLFVMEGSSPLSSRKYQRIKLESVIFNSVFKVYATNEHEAFYILTPHFMESLLELEKHHPGKITMSFKENKLNIAIYNNIDSFKCPMFKKFNEELINNFTNDLKLIEKIIRSLKLDQK